MKDFIDACLVKAEVKYLAKRVHIVSSLDYYKVTFKDKYDRYRKFEAFYNDTDIFALSSNTKMIGGSRDEEVISNFQDKVLGCVNDYPSFEECNKNSIQNISQSKIDSFLLRIRKELVKGIYNISVPNVIIDFVDVTLKPTFLVIIRYRVNGVFMLPLKGFIGEPIICKELNSSSFEFCGEVNNLLSKFLLKRI